MSFSRRDMLRVTAVTAAAAMSSQLPRYAFAAPAAGHRRVDVVKIVSFGCEVSRASENFDTNIRAAVEKTGGKLVFSPFPTEGDHDMPETVGVRERVYYASRQKGAVAENLVRKSLFKGVQDMGLPLGDYMQVYTWLSKDVPELTTSFGDIFKAAQEAEARDSLGKAAYLAHTAGSSALPSYVILVEGEVKMALGPEDVPGGALVRLRDEVISTVQKLSSKDTHK